MQPAQRSELEDNDLAAATLETVERIRPHLWSIAAVIGLALAGIGLWTVTTSQQAAARAAAWRAGLAAERDGNAAGLEGVARQYAGTPAADWADLSAAAIAFDEGADLLFVDRGRAMKRLDAAAATYGLLLGGRTSRLIAERAVFGLAKTNEARGDLKAARQGYEAVVRDYAGGVCAGVAAARAAALARPSTTAWYDWFASQDFASLDKSPPPEPAGSPANAPPASSGKPGTGPGPDAPAATTPPAATAKPEPEPAAGGASGSK